MGTVGASMYVSALEDTVGCTSTKDGVPSSKASGGNLLTQSVIIGKAALDREASIKEKFHRRLLFAGEKLLSAQLSIDEVLLSISSKGKSRNSLTGRCYRAEICAILLLLRWHPLFCPGLKCSIFWPKCDSDVTCMYVCHFYRSCHY